MKEIIYAPKNFIIEILQQWNKKGLPETVIDYILKMLNLSSIWETEDFAKEFRARVRRAMLSEKKWMGLDSLRKLWNNGICSIFIVMVTGKKGFNRFSAAYRIGLIDVSNKIYSITAIEVVGTYYSF